MDELDPTFESYEDWLKKEMGEEYASQEEMVKKEIKLDQEEMQESKQYPDKIVTNFEEE
jgi:hypothetical protein